MRPLAPEPLEVGDVVKIEAGVFAQLNGKVTEIFPKLGTAEVEIPIFGRSTRANIALDCLTIPRQARAANALTDLRSLSLDDRYDQDDSADGSAGAGVPAPLLPRPPVLVGKDAKPFPPIDEWDVAW